MPKLLIPGMPPQALPVVIAGYLMVRNFGAAKKRRNAARVSGHATASRRSSTEGMDGEAVYVPRRNKKGRTILRR